MGTTVNIKTIGKILKQKGLRAKAARKYKATTNSSHKLPVTANILNREFQATEPNQKWAGDISVLWQSTTDDGGYSPSAFGYTGPGCKPPHAARLKRMRRERCGKGVHEALGMK
jgi:hypothetical protein